MDAARERFCMGLSLMMMAGLLSTVLPAAQVVQVPVKPNTPPATTPPPQAPKPWVPPAYPERVSLKAVKDGDKTGGVLADSLGINNATLGVKIHNSMSVPEGMVVDIGNGSKVFCMPQVGKPDTAVDVDGWINAHGSATAPAYFGAYEGRVKMSVSGGAIKAVYTVFKNIDFENRSGLMDFKNCLFIGCTVKVDGSAGGQVEMTNCTLQESPGKTALWLVRSVRGPVTRLKAVKIDGCETGMVVDAYDSMMARTCIWEAKDLSFSNVSGKAIVDSDPIRVDLGRVYLMGEKDAKAAAEKWVEYKTPGNNQVGTPAVTLTISATEIPQIGASLTDPTKKEAPGGAGAAGNKGVQDDG